MYKTPKKYVCMYVCVAVGDSQEFQEVSRPVSWSKDYLTGS